MAGAGPGRVRRRAVGPGRGAARLEELRLAALEALVELRLAAGGHAGLVEELEGLVAAHPTGSGSGPADAGPVPVGAAGGRALGVPADPRGAGARSRPVAGAAAAAPGGLVQDPALELAGPGRRQARHNLPERLTSLVGRDQELRGVASCWSSTGWSRWPVRGGGQDDRGRGAGPAAGGPVPGRVWLVELARSATRPCWPRSWWRPWGWARAADPQAPPRPRPPAWPASPATGAAAGPGQLRAPGRGVRRAGPGAAPGRPGGPGPGHQPRGPRGARGGGLAGPPLAVPAADGEAATQAGLDGGGPPPRC